MCEDEELIIPSCPDATKSGAKWSDVAGTSSDMSSPDMTS